MSKWWGIPFFLAFIGAIFVLPCVPPMNTLLRSIACEPGETYEWLSVSTGIETTGSFVCIDAKGKHQAFNTDTPPGEIKAFGVNIAVAFALTGGAYLLLGWWLRRRRRLALGP